MNLFPLLISSLLLFQSTPGFPEITRADLPGARFTRDVTFTGESLYGYINGGADLYLEYGFSGLKVLEFTYKKEKYKVELWRMNDPESAFGIFSAARFRCLGRPPVAPYTCLNRYQFQMCAGNFYVNIINQSGSPAAGEMAVNIGKMISGRIDGESPDFASLFPSADPVTVRNEAKLAKGKLGIVNGTPDFEELFRGAEGYVSVIVILPERSLLSVRFGTAGEMNKFIAGRGWEVSSLSENPFIPEAGVSVTRKGPASLFIEITDKE